MTEQGRARYAAIAVVAATLVCPLFGAWIAGRDLAPLFAFPPRLAVPAAYPRFSWAAFAAVALPFAALAIFWRRNHRGGSTVSSVMASPRSRKRYPWWGWVAVGWTLAWWALAWNRFTWFQALQRYTFFPLWIGFIVVVNAFTFRHVGSCHLTRPPGVLVRLFATSAVFWWVFEWLNRFTRNWHYLGVQDFGATAYAFHGTLCFSTVLPAVAAVAEMIGTWPTFQAGCAAGPRLPCLEQRATAVILVGGGTAGLIGAGLAPQLFYAALWCGPLALLLADSIVARSEIPHEVSGGDWRRVGTWAVAALVCGFFWELWNIHSAAKWIYTVPYVDRWHVFEMPVLGYAGYLPFGLECYYVASRVIGPAAAAPLSMGVPDDGTRTSHRPGATRFLQGLPDRDDPST